MKSVNLGILQTLMDDPAINEIMVNGHNRIFVEKRGRLERSGAVLSSEAELTQIIHKIAAAKGVTLDDDSPCMDGSLADGSRINIVLPPMAKSGPTLTIRKFAPSVFSLGDLVQLETLSERCAYFLSLCVLARANIVVSGGTSSGKTTFLNALANVVPQDERIVTIEDTAELRLSHPNWVRLEAVNSIHGEKVSIRDCLVNALRMRPDRIIVGECRRNETFEMLQAMNTGHSGSLTTVHANSSRDCLSRIESLVLSNGDFPLLALRKQIASAVDFIIQLRRDKSGERLLTDVLEITGTEGDMITAQNVFSLDSLENSVPTGLLPRFVTKIQECGLRFPENFFDPQAKVKLPSIES